MEKKVIKTFQHFVTPPHPHQPFAQALVFFQFLMFLPLIVAVVKNVPTLPQPPLHLPP